MRNASIAVALACAVQPRFATALDDTTVNLLNAQGQYCSATARTLQLACDEDADSSYWVAFGICINEPDDVDRAKCFADARTEFTDSKASCDEQLAGRQEACGVLGQARYHPEFEPQLFDANFAHLSNPNRYFPLGIGNRWEFRSATESTKVEVLNETKLIDEVPCVVVRDEVRENGVLTESTNDWFAQAKDGNVWYCGEESRSFETFAGDRPRKPELVSIDGSFKAGRNEDQPGVIFRSNPSVGEVYREEASLQNAEDAAKILSTNYAYGKNASLDRLVPRRLAQMLCANDCVVTENLSLLEPGVIERKYYAPGIGVFLETEAESGEVLRLVGCNVDPRCATLPQ